MMQNLEEVPIKMVLGLTAYSVMLTYYWIGMYRDRNYLVQQLRQAIDNAEAKNEPISQPLDDSSEYQSHHAQK